MGTTIVLVIAGTVVLAAVGLLTNWIGDRPARMSRRSAALLLVATVIVAAAVAVLQLLPHGTITTGTHNPIGTAPPSGRSSTVVPDTAPADGPATTGEASQQKTPPPTVQSVTAPPAGSLRVSADPSTAVNNGRPLQFTVAVSGASPGTRLQWVIEPILTRVEFNSGDTDTSASGTATLHVTWDPLMANGASGGMVSPQDTGDYEWYAIIVSEGDPLRSATVLVQVSTASDAPPVLGWT